MGAFGSFGRTFGRSWGAFGAPLGGLSPPLEGLKAPLGGSETLLDGCMAPSVALAGQGHPAGQEDTSLVMTLFSGACGQIQGAFGEFR